jgi:hypothetical protein
MRLKEKVIASLSEQMSSAQASKKGQIFLASLANQILMKRGQNLKVESRNNAYYISMTQLRKSTPRMAVGNKMVYVTDYLFERGLQSGVMCEELGSNINGKLTLITVDASREELMSLVDYSKLKQDNSKELEKPMESQWVSIVDLNNIYLYIQACERQLETETTKWRRQELSENISQAKSLMVACEEDQGVYYLTQKLKRNEFGGRWYAQGVNLQNMPRAVRAAAFAGYYQYDIRCASYAILYSLFQGICRTEGINQFTLAPAEAWTAMEAYIRDRNAVRLGVFNFMFGKTETPQKHRGYYAIKEAFTAIGFGARANPDIFYSGKYGALSSIFNSVPGDATGREHTERFLENNMVKLIVQAFQGIMEVVAAYYWTDRGEVIPGFPLPGKLTKSRLVAHVYQSHESIILKQIIDALGADKIALPVHDAVVLYERDHDNVIQTVCNNYSSYIGVDSKRYGDQESIEQIEYMEELHRQTIREQDRLATAYRQRRGESFFVLEN